MSSDFSTPRTTTRSAEHFVAAVEETPVAAIDTVKVDSKPSNLWRDAWGDLKHRPMFWISGVLIVFIAIVALFPGLFSSVDPARCDLQFIVAEGICTDCGGVALQPLARPAS